MGRKGIIPEQRQFGMNKPSPQTPLQTPHQPLHSSFFTTKASSSYKAVSECSYQEKPEHFVRLNNWPHLRFSSATRGRPLQILSTASYCLTTSSTPAPPRSLSPSPLLVTCRTEMETTGGSVLRPHLSDTSIPAD